MFSPLLIQKKYLGGICLLIIIILAIILRIVYYQQVSHNPEYNTLILDPQFNDYWAKRIIYGPSYPSPTGEDPMIENTPYGRPPAYPYLLSIIYYTFGETLSTARTIQTLMGMLNIVLMYFVAKKLFNNYLSGILASFLFAILWQPIYFEQEINYPTWLTTVIILLIWTFNKYLLSNKTTYLTLSGIILGIFVLFRPNALILYIPIICFIIYKQKTYPRKTFQSILIYTLVVLLTILPVFIRNYIVSREFFLISCFGGVNAYIGNNPYSTGDSPNIPQINDLCGLDNWSCFNYRYLVAGLGIKQKGTPFSFTEASNFFYQKAIQFWKDQPYKALQLTFRKFLLFWGPHIVSDGKVIQCEIEDTILKYLPGFSLLLCLFLFSLLCLLFKLFPKPSKTELELLWFLVSFTIFYSLSVIPFFVAERYRFPLIPSMALFSSSVLNKLLANNQLPNIKNKFKITLLLIISVIISHVSIVSYTPNKSRYLYHKALAHVYYADLETAKNTIEEAIKLNSQNHEYYLLLGTIYLQKNNLTEARSQLSKALEINSKSAIAHNNLGYIEELENHFEMAKELYEKSVKINPVYTSGWINLGRIYLYNLNMPKDAKPCFLKAVEIDPNLWKTWFHLGNTYLVLGELAMAEESLTKALTLNPQNPHILNNLGLTYLQMEKLETAKEFFERATMLDNTLPDPIFNLGRVYQKLSLNDEARKCFEKVVAIQPNYPGVQEELKKLEN